MDKYENKVKLDEIKALISEGAYEDAAAIADTIEWSAVKNVSSIGLGSDLYKALHRFEESRNVLTYAYERQASRPIVRSMCELSIEMGDLMNAIEYFKEFKEIAPKDPARYILQYKIFKKQNISLEEQIEVLEALKEAEYMAKWAYELATLYHRAGMESMCVNECNEIILWFVDGKYVLKAYELKAQHQPLTEQENYKYEVLRQAGGHLNIQMSLREEEPKEKERKEFAVGQDVSPFNTQNLQAVVAEGLQDVFDKNTAPLPEIPPATIEEAKALDEEIISGNETEVQAHTSSNLFVTQIYNSIAPEPPVGQELVEEENAEPEKESVVHSDTDILGDATVTMASDILSGLDDEDDGDADQLLKLNKNTDEIKLITGELPKVELTKDTNDSNEDLLHSMISDNKNPLSDTGVIETFHKGSSFDDMLTQGYDGQISLVIPDDQVVEKQITGQLSIDDVMQEWERKKRENEAKLVQEVRARIHGQASSLLADFDEATKSSLLGQIENAMVNAALKEEHDRILAGRPKEIKVSDIDTAETAKEAVKAPAKAAKAALEAAPVIEAVEKTAEGIVEEAAKEVASEAIENVKAADEVIKKATEADKTEKVEEVPKSSKKTKKKTEIVEEAVEEDDASTEDDGIEEIEEIEEIEDVEESEDIADEDDEIEESEAYDEDEEDEFDEEEVEEDIDDEYEDEDSDVESSEEASVPRDLTDAEYETFRAFASRRKTQQQLAEVLDNVSLASYTGNVLVASDVDEEITTFSKLLIQEIQQTDSNFTGKVAMISGENLNKKDIGQALEKVKNGAMIISEPQMLKKKTVETLLQELDKDGFGLVIIMQGHGDVLDKIVAQNEGMAEAFNLRVDLEAFDDKTLVDYAHNYAYDQGYSIDDLASLALHTRINNMQTADHEVTLAEIEDMVEDAIYYAEKKTPAHIFGAIFGKKYDDEDLVILHEKDFMHYDY